MGEGNKIKNGHTRNPLTLWNAFVNLRLHIIPGQLENATTTTTTLRTTTTESQLKRARVSLSAVLNLKALVPG